jgi:hypothetical protein
MHLADETTGRVVPMAAVRAERQGGPTRDRRHGPRYAVHTPLLVVPVTPDGLPRGDIRAAGLTRDISTGGIGFECESPDGPCGAELIVGLQDAQGVLRFEGVEVRGICRLGHGRVRIAGRFRGLVHDVLTAESLKPAFDPGSLGFTLPFAEELLQALAEVGVLECVAEDRVQLCPGCHALPCFRPGCPACGGARTAGDRFIHHYPCALVAPVADFEADGELVCPKCRTRRLVVGSDFEYLTGAHRCPDCHWSGTDLEHVGQCLRCGLRFPGYQAFTLELCTYHAHRLDPLAVVARP